MSYAMTHLIIAYRFLEQKEIPNKKLFILGSIAPDAVHSRKDFSFRLKGDAHMMQREATWGQIYLEEDMDIWFEGLKAFYKERSSMELSSDEISFLQGYTLHALVDIFNCSLFYAKQLIKYDFQVDKMRDKYRAECILQDNYLYQNYPEAKEALEAAKEAGTEYPVSDILHKLRLDEFISQENINASVAYQLSGYEKAEPSSLENLEMVSKEATEQFIDKLVSLTTDILFAFNKPDRAFIVE